MSYSKDNRIMKYALSLARKGYHGVSPNPPVGAVVTKNGRIISTGYHQKAGSSHAERIALSLLSSEETKGADLYVTLEPCMHQGRTAPCAELIKEAGIKRLVYGTPDPNPLASGGAAFLSKHGIKVEISSIEHQCRSFIEPWRKWNSEETKTIEALICVSLDGAVLEVHDDLFVPYLNLHNSVNRSLRRNVQKEATSAIDLRESEEYHFLFCPKGEEGQIELVQLLSDESRYKIKIHFLRVPLFKPEMKNAILWQNLKQYTLSNVKMIDDAVFESYDVNSSEF